MRGATHAHTHARARTHDIGHLSLSLTFSLSLSLSLARAHTHTQGDLEDNLREIIELVDAVEHGVLLAVEDGRGVSVCVCESV